MTTNLLKELGYENWNDFNDQMQPRSPNEWYSLLKDGYFNVVLTANFDSYLQKRGKLTQFGSKLLQLLFQ